MIPVRLCLRNFLCYGDNVPPLDFSDIHLACLSGENGHGKSALLDAITWALWGKARASTDELIRFGETEMEVEFEFLLGGNAYRVIRKRDKRGRGQTTLDLHARVDDAFHPMTEPNMRATQARIVELLRMEYETFINSAFLLQGRADEFTVKTPMERKQILAEILGLSIYDEYETRAKERARARDADAKALSAQIAEWDRELSQRPLYETELAQAEKRVTDLGERLHTLDGQVQALRRERQDLQAKQAQLLDLQTRLARQQGDLASLRERIEASQQRIGGYERILAERGRIEKGYQDLLAARRRHEELNLQLQEVLKLSQHRMDLEKQVEAKRQEFLMERRRLDERAAELKQKIEGQPRWTAELHELEVPLNNLAALETRLSTLREQLAQDGEEVARLQAQAEQFQTEIQASTEKRTLLSSAQAQCPLCGSSLTDDHRDRLLAEMLVLEEEKEQTRRTTQERIANLTANTQSLRTEVRKAEKQLGNLPGLLARKAKLEAVLEEAVQAETALATLQPQMAELVARIRRADWATEIQADLKEVESELAAVGYDEVAHQQVRTLLSELGVFEDERTRLFTAEENLRNEHGHLAQFQQTETQSERELASTEERVATLTGALRRWDACLSELHGLEGELTTLQAEEAKSRQSLGAARQKLDTCANLEKLREQKMSERTAVLNQKAIYEELRLAFSKRGLQAMIIENIIPEIEDEANAILFRMTDGRMRLKLDTQRENKDKEIVETLDITVSDESGPRSYDLYSGGEAFRINFALRVALSKLLARRAGASLQTLVIDEGFGTQDAQGRERLIEAINSIQDDFEKVLVITHIEELREAFPVHIEVFKTASGSQIRVS